MIEIREKLESLSVWIVKITGGSILLFLCFYAMRYTHYMIPRQIERAEVLKDNLFLNILYLVLFLIILLGLHLCEKKIDERIRSFIAWFIVLLSVAWITNAGFWWINSVDRVPEADQIFVYAGASYFIEGMYSFLNPQGGYFSIYPYQLPLVALIEGLFRIVGPFNYYAYQVLNVLFEAGIVILGYLLVREKSKKLISAVAYAFLMASCFPLFFYSGWVYGEIPCLFFTFFAAWTLYKYTCRRNAWWLIGTVFGLTMALATRKNATILVVAFCILSIVYAVCKKEKWILVAACASVICPMLVYSGVYKMYEVRSGYEHTQGMPSSLFFELGMHESSGRYGWDDMSALELFHEVEFDIEKAGTIAKEKLQEDINRFKSDLGYTKVFFREKILSQWNNPLFQCLFFSANYREENLPEQGTLVYKISHDYFFEVLRYSDIIHLLIFVGTFFYFLFVVNKESDILQLLLAVALIGGFFFSILWEAKARYIFPYYVTMFPMAVMGYGSLIEKIQKLINKYKVKRQ